MQQRTASEEECYTKQFKKEDLQHMKRMCSVGQSIDSSSTRKVNSGKAMLT